MTADVDLLRRVRAVLVGTTHPGNIGAAARALKTMGLTRLILVDPQNYPNVEATARASGADDVLYRAEVVGTLDAALRGCRHAFGVSARRRGIAAPTLRPRRCAALALDAAAAGDEVALVFGRERSGLSNDELDRCQYLVRIPANPDYPSLNLAAAVQLLAYELRLYALDGGAPTPALAVAADPALHGAAAKPADRPATSDELERFYAHLQQTLIALGFLNPDHPRHLMRRLRRLYNRARPEQREVNILRGILTAIDRRDRHG